MKHYLLLFILFVGLSAHSQNSDSLPVHNRAWSWIYEKQERIPDTVRVIMLVCDTMFVRATNFNTFAYWMYGYSAGRKEQFMNAHGQYEYKHFNEAYLQGDKLPMPKHIIVWMSKELSSK